MSCWRLSRRTRICSGRSSSGAGVLVASLTRVDPIGAAGVPRNRALSAYERTKPDSFVRRRASVVVLLVDQAQAREGQPGIAGGDGGAVVDHGLGVGAGGDDR